MSKLKEKSTFNIIAAEQLIESSLFAPSVHCSYYSCFQLLKYTMKKFCGMDYPVQAANIASSKQKTHQYVINYMFNELTRFEGLIESSKFRHRINDLKQYREEADYDDVEVSLDKSKSAFRLAEEIRTEIVKKFNV